MTRDQKLEAIKQMKIDCEIKMDIGNYEMVSARGILYNLGYHGDDCDDVIELIRLGGFTNCLDPSVWTRDRNGKKIIPSEDVCHWGPDQMLSRLKCLFIR